ncbi:flagellar basal-body rod modification protein FlgD [Nocardioides scoriae]|uniref:Flagellar basal-body rod modification protein FlgD n=1 Tax=Nocardioides scoriae TaxID=642780 RepID=A0A1H1S7P1_9ACTN|nr:flagellar hook capping FlgD N-terminal domain-containing protein [Nocardioides scoriae]SDS43776.1 flagellar basal-body rod modification protein FlgD [Nocardioides scoriae]
MSIAATEPVTHTGMLGTVPGADTSAKTKLGNSQDKDMFLQLLVAQMKYQDPTNPTDSAQFLAQSAQFTALEKMQAVADQTAQLVSAQLSFGASGLVGRTVTWTDTEGTSQTGLVNGVSFGADGPSLDVGGTTVALGQVQRVDDGTRTATPSVPTVPSTSV